MIDIFTRNLLAKLGSIILAIGIWYFISTSQNTTTSSEFTVPVVYDGIETDQIVRGAPASVLVKVVGLRNQIRSLEEENFSALIDFSDVQGEYEKEIIVVRPQGVTVVGVTPETAIGTVENIETKTVPVELSLLGQAPEDTRANLRSRTTEARVLGASSSLLLVSKVIASVPAVEGDAQVTLFAAAQDNTPVRDNTITVLPQSLEAQVSFEAIMFSKSVPIDFSNIIDQFSSANVALSSVSLSQEQLRIAGSKAALDRVDEVAVGIDPVSLDPVTQDSAEGEYTLLIVPLLPAEISALEQLSITVVLSQPEPSSVEPGEPDSLDLAPSPDPSQPESSQLGPDINESNSTTLPQVITEVLNPNGDSLNDETINTDSARTPFWRSRAETQSFTRYFFWQ